MNTDPHTQATPNEPNVPAGWYPDGQGSQRWWDGTQWTEHAHPDLAAQAGQADAADQVDQTAQTDQAAQFEPTAQPPRKRTGLVITLVAAGAAVVLGGAAVIGMWVIPSMLKANERQDPEITEVDEIETPDVEPTEDPSDEPDSGSEFSDVFAEREQFMIDQQLPLDGSLLQAVTPEQHEFVQVMKQQFATNGVEFTKNDESVVLALAADACETAILSSHDSTDFVLRGHAITSPLIAEITKNLDEPTKSQAIDNLMYTAATGMSYMCPADADGWFETLDAIGGDW